MKEYIFGLLEGGMTGGGCIRIGSPLLQFSAASEGEAQKEYCKLVTAASCCSAHLVGVKETADWVKTSKHIDDETFNKIVEELQTVNEYRKIAVSISNEEKDRIKNYIETGVPCEISFSPEKIVPVVNELYRLGGLEHNSIEWMERQKWQSGNS